MQNKITEIIDTLRVVEEKACRVGFDLDDAKYHISLLKELKAECDESNLDCREFVKELPLANVDFTAIQINC